MIEGLSRVDAKEGKSLNDFKFGTFTGRLPSDGPASMAVKGLTHRKGEERREEAQCSSRSFSVCSPRPIARPDLTVLVDWA